MKAFEQQNGFVLVFELGESFHSQLIDFAQSKNMKSAFYWGLGAASDVELGFYELQKKDYLRKSFNEELEVTQLVGNLSLKEGKVFPHTHICLGREDFSLIGGHLFDLKVGPTLEVNLQPQSSVLKREFDERIGLHLIQSCGGH